MRDITHRKIIPAAVPHLEHSHAPHQTTRIRESKTERFFRSIFHTINFAGGALTGESNYQREEQLNAPTGIVHKPKKVRKERTPGKTKEALANSGRRIKRAGKHFRTPIGKVAAVNTVALFALFAFVFHNQSIANDQFNENGSLVTTGNVKRYLPNVANTSKSESFVATEAASKDKLPLYVWVTPWNAAEVTSNSNAYSSISAFWLSLNEDGSSITPKASWDKWDSLVSTRRPNQTNYLTISSDPNFSYKALINTDTQRKLIENLLKLATEHGATGVDIDFEALGSDNRDLFTNFIRNLSTRFHEQGRKVSVTVEARIANQVPMDWHNLGQIADEVRIMVYDYHGRITGTPGPITPLAWLKEVTEYALQEIPKEKVVIGLGNYGYDWTAPTALEQNWQGSGVSFDRAIALAAENNTPVVQSTGIDERGYDIGIAPNFTYTDGEGNTHSVWFEDKQSLTMKLDLLSHYQLKGVIFWSVGLGDQSFWESQQK